MTNKRKHSDQSLCCTVLKGVGLDILWNVDNVRQVLEQRVPVASEWLDVNGLVVELLLQPFAGKGFMGEDTMGLLFSTLGGHEGKNLPAAVRFQVINHFNPSSCFTLDEGRGLLRLGQGSWGTEELIPVAALLDPQLGYVVGDRLTVRVEARLP